MTVGASHKRTFCNFMNKTLDPSFFSQILSFYVMILNLQNKYISVLLLYSPETMTIWIKKAGERQTTRRVPKEHFTREMNWGFSFLSSC